MKALDFRSQFDDFTDEELAEIELIVSLYDEEDDSYYESDDFLFLKKEFVNKKHKLVITDIDYDDPGY